MLTGACTSDVLLTLPLIHVARPCTPADFQDLSYAPGFLIEYLGNASITTHPEYRSGCKDGFHGYFDEMFVWNESGTDLVFRDHFYTRTEVITFLVNCIIKDRYLDSRIVIPFSFSVGFALGWLSALALTNYPLALSSLELLTVLVDQLRKVFA